MLNLGLATDCNTSGLGYKLVIEEIGKILISYQARFDETSYQRRNIQMIEDHLTNITEIDSVSLDKGDMR